MTSPEAQSPADTTVVLCAVGDVSFGDHPVCVGHGIYSKWHAFTTHTPQYPFSHVAHLLRGADLTIGNLETVLSEIGARPRRLETLEMRGRPAAADALAAAGFTAMNIANNHILQHGEDAYRETVRSLESRRIVVVGDDDGSGVAAQVRYVEVRGRRIALLGYAFELDKYHIGQPLYAYGPACNVLDQVADARRRADVVVCSVHWGDEFVRYPSLQEIQLGRAIVDAGAQVVLGHHPHVVRGVERYRNGVIAYSLGNFTFDMLWNEHLRLGVVLRVAVSGAGVEDVRHTLVRIGDDFQPRPIHAAQEADAYWDWVNAQLVVQREDQEYARDLAAAIVANRHESWGHFGRHLFQRPLPIAAQMVWRSLKDKLASQFHPVPE